MHLSRSRPGHVRRQLPVLPRHKLQNIWTMRPLGGTGGALKALAKNVAQHMSLSRSGLKRVVAQVVAEHHNLGQVDDYKGHLYYAKPERLNFLNLIAQSKEALDDLLLLDPRLAKKFQRKVQPRRPLPRQPQKRASKVSSKTASKTKRAAVKKVPAPGPGQGSSSTASSPLPSPPPPPMTDSPPLPASPPLTTGVVLSSPTTQAPRARPDQKPARRQSAKGRGQQVSRAKQAVKDPGQRRSGSPTPSRSRSRSAFRSRSGSPAKSPSRIRPRRSQRQVKARSASYQRLPAGSTRRAAAGAAKKSPAPGARQAPAKTMTKTLTKTRSRTSPKAVPVAPRRSPRKCGKPAAVKLPPKPAQAEKPQPQPAEGEPDQMPLQVTRSGSHSRSLSHSHSHSRSRSRSPFRSRSVSPLVSRSSVTGTTVRSRRSLRQVNAGAHVLSSKALTRALNKAFPQARAKARPREPQRTLPLFRNYDKPWLVPRTKRRRLDAGGPRSSLSLIRRNPSSARQDQSVVPVVRKSGSQLCRPVRKAANSPWHTPYQFPGAAGATRGPGVRSSSPPMAARFGASLTGRQRHQRQMQERQRREQQHAEPIDSMLNHGSGLFRHHRGEWIPAMQSAFRTIPLEGSKPAKPMSQQVLKEPKPQKSRQPGGATGGAPLPPPPPSAVSSDPRVRQKALPKPVDSSLGSYADLFQPADSKDVLARAKRRLSIAFMSREAKASPRRRRRCMPIWK